MNLFTRQCLVALMLFCAAGFTQELKAQCATGETAYSLTVTPASFPAELSWDIVEDATSTVVASAACGTYASGLPGTDTVCLTNGTNYTLNLYDDWGDTWNGGTFDFMDIDCGGTLASGDPDNLLGGDGTDDCIGHDLEQSYSFTAGGPYSGCTDPSAINYNPCATIDDGSCLFPAVNDECVDAIAVPVGSCYTGTNIGATHSASAGAPGAACYATSPTPLDIWFTTLVPASGNLQITLPVVPGFSSYAELYGGSCSALVNLTSTAGTPCINLGAGGFVIATGLTPGAQIWIRYWDFGNDDFGSLEICLDDPVAGCIDPCADNFDSLALVDDGSCVGTPTGAGSDECVSATALPGPGMYEQYNAMATASAGGDITSCTFNDLIDVWFSYAVPAGLDTFEVWTCANSYDTGLSFWSACDSTGTEIACNDDGFFPASGGSTCGGSIFSSQIILTGAALDAIEGTTIYIRVTGYNGQVGCGELNIKEVATPLACDASVPPTGFAPTISGGTLTFNWDPFPGAVGCQLQAGPSGGGFPITRNFPGVGVTTSGPIPTSIIAPGNYQARLICACSIDPLIVSPPTNSAQFTISAPRMGAFTELSLSPNPATDVLNLNISGEAQQNVSFSITDMLGRVISNNVQDLAEGMNSLQFDLSRFESGMYFLQITTGEEVTVEQFEVIK